MAAYARGYVNVNTSLRCREPVCLRSVSQWKLEKKKEKIECEISLVTIVMKIHICIALD